MSSNDGSASDNEKKMLNNETDSPQIGSILLSRYKIEQVFGEGKWGVVFRAHDLQLHRTVAIKYLKHNLIARDEKLKRFVQEARIVAKLSHPNIVIIYDLDEPREGDYVIVMEYAQKGTLRLQLDSSPDGLPILEALRLAIGICSGLEAVHNIDVIHRDLKPTNVLLFEEDGQLIPKIADFGIARTSPDGSSDGGSSSERVIGTPLYMSPEAAAMKKVQPASDLFSFGIILYELLTGKMPFPGGVIDVLINQTPLTPPIELNPNIPPRLNEIVKQCLEMEPSKRFVSARRLREVLTAVQADEERRQKAAALETLRRSIKGSIAHEDWLAAEKALEEVLKLDPDDQQVRRDLLDVQHKSRLHRMYQEAVEHSLRREWHFAATKLLQVVATEADYRDAATRLIDVQIRDRADHLLDEGKNYLIQGNWLRAVDRFSEVLTKQPSNKEAEKLLQEARQKANLAQLRIEAESYYQSRQWALAIQKLEEIRRLDPGNQNVQEKLKTALEEKNLTQWLSEASLAQERKDWRKAKRYLEQIVETRREYATAADQLRRVEGKLALESLAQRAIQCEKAEDWAAAVSAYRNILDIDADHPGIIQRLAHAQQQVRLNELYSEAIALEKEGQGEAANVLHQRIVAIQETFKDSAFKLQGQGHSTIKDSFVDQIWPHRPSNRPTLPQVRHLSLKKTFNRSMANVSETTVARATIAAAIIGGVFLILSAALPSILAANNPEAVATTATVQAIPSCLDEATIRLVIKDVDTNQIISEISGTKTIDLPTPTAKFTAFLESKCRGIDNLVAIGWKAGKGSFDSLQGKEVRYMLLGDSSIDSLTVIVSVPGTRARREFSFFISIQS